MLQGLDNLVVCNILQNNIKIGRENKLRYFSAQNS